jgi:hypothetical protein
MFQEIECTALVYCHDCTCRYDISGWCTDRGALVTWNLGRESVKQNKPDTLIDVDVCLMSCAFHPEHPVSLNKIVHSVKWYRMQLLI